MWSGIILILTGLNGAPLQGANQNQLCGQFVYYQESSRINIHDLGVNGKCIDTVLEEIRYDSIRHFELSLYSLADSGLDLLCSQVVFVVGQEEIYGKMKDNVCRFQLENVACEMIEMQNGDEVYHGITSENDGCMFKDPHSQIEGSSSYVEFDLEMYDYYVTNWVNASTTI